MIHPNVLEHYRLGFESTRLSDIHLEKIRTERLLDRLLPAAPARILDVGGAHGIYSFFLAKKGYQVTLVDPVPLHIEQAKETNQRSGGVLAAIELGDARELKFGEGGFDAVLLMGPLYHLTERADRLLAIRNARRVLKPGGKLVTTYVSRFASLIDGIGENRLGDDVFAAIVEQDLQTGQHRNPTNHPEYFTDAYFHHPEECRSELLEAGFSAVKLINIEGPFWSHENLGVQMADEKIRARILKFLDQIECEESLMGSGAHLMSVAVKSKE